FDYLRQLLRWMEVEGFCRFADLDASALRRFQHAIEQRKPYGGMRLTPSTVQKYLDLLVYMYRHRDELSDGLAIDPCPGQSTGSLAGVRESNRGRWPHTPEVIAIPLIQGAIAFLELCAVDLLRARTVYAHTVAEAQCRSDSDKLWREEATQALERITVNTPRGLHAITSAADLAALLNTLYTACFIVISYLVGPRASEILQLLSGCIQPLEADDSPADAPLAVIAGAIFKREAAYHGRRHQWVAPPPAAHAIAVLEALSAPHRGRSGRQELWLRTRGPGYCETEWHSSCSGDLRVMATTQMRSLLRRCSPWFNVPLYEGKPWRLSTHQGRKTFVRFAASRDRTALFALAQHLGHRERGTTDRYYVGSDHLLNREIDAAILEESVSAWEHMLSTTHLGGRAGAEIIAQRPRFRGSHMKQQLARYASMLVESGLTLGVCEWGFCVYQQDHSACLGSTSAPNPLRREPSTCARCQNFAVSTPHRSYWSEQARRSEALLNEPALPTQTLKIARERLK
ncbi:MAG: hypothetical protein ACREHV_00690, partial [Rhizomicrobium sp.]